MPGWPYRTDFSPLNCMRLSRMTAIDNIKILNKILDGIANGNLDEVMSPLKFEASKEDDKSKEWTLQQL